MSGVSWNERSTTDWLASNGRWYPQSKYPSGWTMSSLPPAPEHARTGSILRRAANQIVADVQQASDDSGSGDSPLRDGGWSSRTSAPPTAGSSSPRGPNGARSEAPPTVGRAQTRNRSFLPKEAPRRQSGPAEAQVVGQSTYKPKVGSGPPPPSALPPPPGRVRDEAPSAPAPPAKPSPPAVRQTAAPREQSDLEVVAGDLGKVLGVAKRRITRAINEAAEQGR